jgi:hypothetical protein
MEQRHAEVVCGVRVFYFWKASIITGGKNRMGTGRNARVIAISVSAWKEEFGVYPM